MVLALRQVVPDPAREGCARLIHVSFWGLDGGLALMVTCNLFPGSVLQLPDVLHNGHWHARSPESLNLGTMRFIEWLRMPGDLLFVGLGVMPIAAAVITYLEMNVQSSSQAEHR